MNTTKSIATTLAKAGIAARVIYDQGMIAIETDRSEAARAALKFDSFTGHINDVEVIIL